jgi:hypothetical protein
VLISVSIVDRFVIPYKDVSGLYVNMLRFVSAIRNIDMCNKFIYESSMRFVNEEGYGYSFVNRRFIGFFRGLLSLLSILPIVEILY